MGNVRGNRDWAKADSPHPRPLPFKGGKKRLKPFYNRDVGDAAAFAHRLQAIASATRL